MSVKQGFLALLAERPMNGYQLRQEFEARTGGTWPLNIGQAYTTLQRLERDGLVKKAQPSDTDSEYYLLTQAGFAASQAWWNSPVERGAPARDELAMKLALAVSVPGVDVKALVQRQRKETLRALRDYTRLKRNENPGALGWVLVLDSLIFQAEAEVRWLDHVEQTIIRAAANHRAKPSKSVVEQRLAGAAVETTRNSHPLADLHHPDIDVEIELPVSGGAPKPRGTRVPAGARR